MHMWVKITLSSTKRYNWETSSMTCCPPLASKKDDEFETKPFDLIMASTKKINLRKRFTRTQPQEKWRDKFETRSWTKEKIETKWSNFFLSGMLAGNMVLLKQKRPWHTGDRLCNGKVTCRKIARSSYPSFKSYVSLFSLLSHQAERRNARFLI